MIIWGLGFAEQADAIATRFAAWQLQGLGALLFVLSVVKVLLSYDKEQTSRDAKHLTTAPNPVLVTGSQRLLDALRAAEVMA